MRIFLLPLEKYNNVTVKTNFAGKIKKKRKKKKTEEKKRFYVWVCLKLVIFDVKTLDEILTTTNAVFIQQKAPETGF